MSAKFFAILTHQGAARLANAAALGTTLNLTQMAVGDANGTLPVPDPVQAKLINQKRIAPLNLLTIDPNNASQIIAEQIIPENEGGFWIRELGLYDDAGVLIAVANCPETYKPQLQEGSGRTQTIRMVLVVSSTESVTLKIDPSVVLATRQYTDDKIIEVKVYTDDLLAKHVAAANPHNQYAPKNSPALTGKPSAPTAAQTENSTQLATTEFVKAAVNALINSAPATLNTLKALADALGNDANFAGTMTTALAGKQPKDLTLTNLSGKDVAGLLAYLGLGSAAKENSGSFISSSGGNYPVYLRMSGIETLPTELTAANLSALYSAPAPIQPGDVAAGAVANWYSHQAIYGLIRNASNGINGWGVKINGQTLFLVTPNGDIYSSNEKLATETKLTNSLATRQTKDQTLTDLSGKTPSQINAYLSLGSAALKTIGNGSGQVPDMSFFNLVGGAAGYVKFPNGFIFQWGVANAGAGSANIAFPLQFPGGCVGVEITGTSARGSADAAVVNIISSELNAGGFGVNGYLLRPGGQVVSQGIAFNYCAWGY